MAVADLTLALPLALGSSLLSGVSDFAGGMAARNGHIFRVLAVTAPISWLVTIALLPVMGADFSRPAVLWGLASGVASTAAFGLFYRCLAIGPMGLLSPSLPFCQRSCRWSQPWPWVSVSGRLG